MSVVFVWDQVYGLLATSGQRALSVCLLGERYLVAPRPDGRGDTLLVALLLLLHSQSAL